MTIGAADFPRGTPLHHFFRWNERRWRPDRRYRLMRASQRLPSPVGEALAVATGNPDPTAHAAVFAGFEALEARPGRRRILVIRLSAFGDFVQALGPFAAIRRHHHGDHVALLTTRPFADFVRELGYFDEVLVDRRPAALALGGWLALRHRVRTGRFDRVYDLQTSHRTAAYAALLRPGMPEWSGVARGCSHPHANLDRDRQHTLDKQAEQLLMAGIHPTPLPSLPSIDRPLPVALAGRDFVMLAPGSSPRHPEKRWPAERFGELAGGLSERGFVPVVVGVAAEAPLAAAIRQSCPDAVDLTGRTDLPLLAALAGRAAVTVGNDTGVCHLAAAAGCPTIVLFSAASDPDRHAPRGRSVRILREPDLNDLVVDRVIAEAAIMLARNTAPPLVAANQSPKTASPAEAGVHPSAIR